MSQAPMEVQKWLDKGVKFFLESDGSISVSCKEEEFEFIHPLRNIITGWLVKEHGIGEGLTSEDKRRIRRIFEEFRAKHGHELVENGWSRETVFTRGSPLDATSWGEVHGIILVLLNGGSVEKVTREWIYLKHWTGERVAWKQVGCFFGDPLLERMEKEI